MKVQFEAEIKKLELKTDIDGCKAGRIWLDFTPTDKQVEQINKIYQPQNNVNVSIENGR
ncbi:MAG: hypothetical protein ACFFDN_19915 [Candidatus Hodarchaeota archaeon]